LTPGPTICPNPCTGQTSRCYTIEEPNHRHRRLLRPRCERPRGRAAEQRRRNFEAERLGSLEIDHEFVFGRLLDWQLGGLLALEDAIDIAGRLPVLIDPIGPIRTRGRLSGNPGVAYEAPASRHRGLGVRWECRS